MRNATVTLLTGVFMAAAPIGASAPRTAGLEFEMPAGWIVGSPSSSMRVAEFTLPHAEGDAEDASVVVYYFEGSGGSVEANLDRWIGQVEQPDGSPTAAVARSSTLRSDGGLAMTLVDVSGTYVAEVRPGSTERFNKPGFRLRAAVIETTDGPYFVKVVGPAATVARWNASYLAFLKSMREGREIGISGNRVIGLSGCPVIGDLSRSAIADLFLPRYPDNPISRYPDAMSSPSSSPSTG